MAVPVARVHLKVAHAALPALLPTPPMCKMMLPLLPTPPPCVAAILSKPLANKKPSRADADERWDAHKAKPASTASSASSSPRSADSINNSAAGRVSCRKNATSPPPPKPGRADSVERWDAHKKAASPASASSSSSSSAMSSSLISNGNKFPMISRASSAERWDAHKERRPPHADGGESSSTGSNDDIHDTEEDKEILWKPRAMYAGPGFAGAAPESRRLPMPTTLLVPVA